MMKLIDGKVYFQSDGFPIVKSISKPLVGILIHWFEKNYVFGENSTLRDNIVCWKRKMDDVSLF